MFHYYDTATVQNKHQLLTRKTSKWHSLIFKKTIIFELSPKLNEMQCLALLRLKIIENLPTIIEKNCVLGLSLGLDHSCPWPREVLSSEELSLASDFFESLALASNVMSSTPPLLLITVVRENVKRNRN